MDVPEKVRFCAGSAQARFYTKRNSAREGK